MTARKSHDGRIRMNELDHGHRAPRSRLALVMRVLLVIYWCGIFYLTHLPGPKLPQIPLSDKIEHYLAFGALGGLLFLALWTNNPRRSDLAFLVLAIGIGYGAVDEWTQALPFVH